MRSIHTTNQQNYNKNNTPYRVIHKHRTKLGNPIRGIIITIISIIALSSILLAGASTTYAEGSGGSVSLSVDNSDVVLELIVPESINLNLTPNSTNNYTSFGTVDLAVSAGTNNPYGYTLTMSVPNTNLTNSSFTLSSNPNNIPLDTSNHPIIPTITSTYTDDSDFPDNTWGYRIGNTAYSPVSSNISLSGTNSAGNATTTTIELAAKVNSSQPAGTYTTTLNFTAVANATFTYTLTNFLADITSAAENCGTVTLLGDVNGNSTFLNLDGCYTINADGYSLSNFNEIAISQDGTYNNLTLSNNSRVVINGGTINTATISNNDNVQLYSGFINTITLTQNEFIQSYGGNFNNAIFAQNEYVQLNSGNFNYPVIGTNTSTLIWYGVYDHLRFSDEIDYNTISLHGGLFTPTSTEGYLTMEEADSIVREYGFCAMPSDNPDYPYPNYFTISSDFFTCFGGEPPIIDPDGPIIDPGIE